MSLPLVDIKKAQVYRGENLVLDDFNLVINPGEHTAIIGPNGCGKSTLLGLLSRDFRAVARKESHVKILGKSREKIFDLRKHLGIISDLWKEKFPEEVSGHDVILSGFFGAVAIYPDMKVSDKQLKKVQALAKLLDIHDLQSKPYTHMSSGQQKRFMIARALVHEPDVLIFDEPTNSLDMKASQEFIKIMQTLADQNHTILLVTHSLEEIIPEIQNIVLMKEGKVFKSGKKSEVLTSENLSYLFDFPDI